MLQPGIELEEPVIEPLGEGEAAIPLVTNALEMRTRWVLPPDSTRADLLSGLAREIRASGDYDRSAELFEEAAAIQEAVLGSDHAAYTQTVLGLASTVHDRGSFEESEELPGKVANWGLGRPDPGAGSALLNLGMVRPLRQQYVEAEPLVRVPREVLCQLYPPDHPAVVETDEQWRQTLAAWGRYPEVLELLGSALDRSTTVLRPTPARTRKTHEGLAQVEWELGRYEPALARLDSEVERKRVAHGGDHPGVIYTLVASGELLAETG